MPSNSKSCHNCRRRRLRCDRSWPTCHKCVVSGQECLGYGRVFVWTQGIDTNGNLKPSPGRKTPLGGPPGPSTVSGAASSSDASTSYFPAVTTAAQATKGFESAPNPASNSTTDPGQGNHQDTCTSALQVPVSEPSTSISSHGAPLPSVRTVKPVPPRAQQQRQRRNYSFKQTLSPQLKSNSNSRDVAAGAAGTNGAQIRAHSPQTEVRPWQPPLSPALASLTDPLFQDLDRNSRYYLSHFADRVCQDLVARDAPGTNPFRELIPLTNKHPLLLQILIATSAIHWSNIFRPITSIPTGLNNPGGYLAQLRSKDLVSRSALIDALTAKQKAMGHLQEVLDTLDPAGSEVALAAMHFFIKFDLIDLEKSEGTGWRAHLEGSSSILALLTSAPDGNKSEETRILRDWVIADCFIYHILGSTLTSGSLAANIARYAFELLPVMKRVEVNSYLSCPPEVLQIILKASQLSNETPCTDWSLSAADEALALIDEALAFDIPAWADRLRANPNVRDIQSRIFIASAHRSAVCLYILQALPLVRAVRPVDTEFLVGDILNNLSQISEGDPYFKATSWPTFIAGAETRDAEKRTWAMKRLLGIWNICPWGYIFTAIEMLKATWQMQDASRNVDEPAVNWLQGLKGMGFDHLIV